MSDGLVHEVVSKRKARYAFLYSDPTLYARSMAIGGTGGLREYVKGTLVQSELIPQQNNPADVL